MKLQDNQRALVIYDQFKGQVTEEIVKFLDDNHVSIVLVSANSMDRFQPMDVSVNKPAKASEERSSRNGMLKRYPSNWMDQQK